MDIRRLYRGKRKDNGEWVEGFYAEFQLGTHSVPFIGASNSIGTMMWIEVRPETVGQFSGVPDKNGKQIFEGSICRVSRPCVITYGHIEFANGCFWFVDSGPGGMLRLCDVRINGFEIEVIGNIHDDYEWPGGAQ